MEVTLYHLYSSKFTIAYRCDHRLCGSVQSHGCNLRLSLKHDFADTNVVYSSKCIAISYRCDRRLAYSVRCHRHDIRLSLNRDLAYSTVRELYSHTQMRAHEGRIPQKRFFITFLKSPLSSIGFCMSSNS